MDGASGGDGTDVVARADGVLGELVLRRRGDVLDLIGNGVFLMDTEDATTERLLADHVLRRLQPVDGRGLRVLVGGLGLGFTAAAVLADDRVCEVVVVEIEPALTAWVRAGLVPEAARLLDDERLRLVEGDVRELLPELPPGRLDAVLLDVDNGPRFLTHPSNAPLYERAGVASAAQALAPRGVLAIWSADRSPALLAVMNAVVGSTEEVPVVVQRSRRELEYVLYVASRS